LKFAYFVAAVLAVL